MLVTRTNCKHGHATHSIFAGAAMYSGLLFLMLFFNSSVRADDLSNELSPEEIRQSKISGTVKDQDGAPVAGASIKIKGKSGGAQTDLSGRFTIEAGANDVLVITAIGYAEKEITVGAALDYNVSLDKEYSELDQVVVVGYGTQKKINLTGSVASIGGAELAKRPATNVQNLLQGKISGLQVTQGSGKPGADNAELRIRGVGTFSGAGSSPLVLIDGVMGDMTSLNPDDIESVSVLKDAASSAIYGARAANGVILVTTKKGKARDLTIQYHGNFQVQKATRLPELLTNSAEYMTLWNEANLRDGLTPHFSQATIDAFKNGNDPDKYPNFDWVDHVFRNALAHNHHIGISGGNEKTTFNLSMGYLDQGGIMSIYDFKKYNLLLSVDTKVKNWLTIGGNIQLSKRDIVQENFGDNDFVMSAYSGPNYTPTMTLPDGSTGFVARYSNTIGEWTVRNPDAITASGSRKINLYSMRPQIYAEVKLAKNLTWLTKGAIGFNSEFNKRHESPINNYYFDDGSYAHNNAVWQQGVRDLMTQNFETTLYSTLNYQKSFGDHDLTILAGYNQESNYYRELSGSRLNFPTTTISELNAGAALGQSTGGTANEWAIQSLFGRLMYDYKGKYLFEVNARRDGTSRIAPETRWGTFPSVSAGWRVSEESFLRSLSWLDNLKLRASWGKLGNQNVGLYPYQDLLSTTSYPFDGLAPGVLMNALRDRNLKWETTTVTDFGADFSMKNGLISLTVDWFNKVTDDILYQIPIPASVGLNSPTINYGKMKNTGWEFELGHRNTIGELSYNVNFNFTTFKNKVLDVVSPTYGNTIVMEGLPFNAYYLIEWDGIFQSQDEIDKAPVHPFNPKPGDLRYRDANDDGVIDSKDRVVVDGAYAKFYYGGSINLAWKNWDLSAFFQGVQGNKLYVGGSHMAWGYTPFVQGSPPTLDYIKDMWTPSNPSNTTPAIYQSQYKPNTGTASTYWLLDASYMRLKNIAIGYTFTNDVTRSIGLKGLRVYVSGDNLLTVTDYPGADPERSCTGCRFSVYPQVTTYAAGVKATL
ncbi:TonB-dependent receptor [Agriterribacter sp.]|uniref:SusC/RagA family TonB-linked outer membrane protein n=1 Tax=Agriterribacter sp. TaxID=2821509 RepID=UPI002BD15C0B|nr:TonB-dependent receptor [Agriterribacter sp.]HRO45737.1 TonB-dependent receptor [Agriterribacter sp.]HRQ15785.1 TonB-dependent receptor [Agriterribacter sp.]